MDEAENQISNLEYKEEKTSSQYCKKKKESKKMRIVEGPLRQLQVYQHSHNWGARRRRGKEIENLFKKISAE